MATGPRSDSGAAGPRHGAEHGSRGWAARACRPGRPRRRCGSVPCWRPAPYWPWPPSRAAAGPRRPPCESERRAKAPAQHRCCTAVTWRRWSLGDRRPLRALPRLGRRPVRFVFSHAKLCAVPLPQHRLLRGSPGTAAGVVQRHRADAGRSPRRDGALQPSLRLQEGPAALAGPSRHHSGAEFGREQPLCPSSAACTPVPLPPAPQPLHPPAGSDSLMLSPGSTRCCSCSIIES